MQNEHPKVLAYFFYSFVIQCCEYLCSHIIQRCEYLCSHIIQRNKKLYSPISVLWIRSS